MPYAKSSTAGQVEAVTTPQPVEWWIIALASGIAAVALVTGLILYREVRA